MISKVRTLIDVGRTVRLDLTSRKFGRLVVLGLDSRAENGGLVWRCECDCGGLKNVRSHDLVAGFVKSCGCLWKESRETHKLTSHPLYKTYRGMLGRCYSENAASFPRYGGRGIKVCERWKGESGLANFIADMGAKPSYSHSIDRKDNDKGYTPENCRWATQSEQSRNTRRNRVLDFEGEKITLIEASEKSGIGRATIAQRLRRGWTVYDALTKPVKKYS